MCKVKHLEVLCAGISLLNHNHNAFCYVIGFLGVRGASVCRVDALQQKLDQQQRLLTPSSGRLCSCRGGTRWRRPTLARAPPARATSTRR